MTTRLSLILLIPTIVALTFGGLQTKSALDAWHESGDAERTARLVRAAASYGQALATERDVSAAPLLTGTDRSMVNRARSSTDAAAEEFHARADEAPHTPTLKRRLAALQKAEPRLESVRQHAYTQKFGGVRTEEAYLSLLYPLTEFANELEGGDADTTSGRAVHAVSRAEAAASSRRSLGTHLLVKPGPGKADHSAQRTAFDAYGYLQEIADREFAAGARQQERTLLKEAVAAADKATEQRAAKALKESRTGATAVDSTPSMDTMVERISSGEDPTSLTERGITPETWYAVSTADFDAYRAAERKLTDAAVHEAADSVADARRDAVLSAALVLAALLVAFAVAGLLARSMSRDVHRLRAAVFEVAEQRLPALVDQLSRAGSGEVHPRVEPIPITGRDEIGEVARAFDQIHREAVRLAAEQATLRGNVNTIFTRLSERNQGLIEHQLTMIGELEKHESDPDQLRNLFRLDHLATRMRRNGENLLVLAGEEAGSRWNEPLPLVDVLRAAASEVEEYDRIELTGVPRAHVRGAAVTDLVHLVAELLENAITHSAPGSGVRVAATRLRDSRVMVEIHDQGAGLSPEDLADINHRLAHPPAVDAAVSRRMGLFVVGRLAARHGVRVQLRPSGDRTGTSSLVMLPEAIIPGDDGQREEEFEDAPPLAPGGGRPARRTAPRDERPATDRLAPGDDGGDPPLSPAPSSAQPPAADDGGPLQRAGRDGDPPSTASAPPSGYPEDDPGESAGPAGTLPDSHGSPAQQADWSEGGVHGGAVASPYGGQPESASHAPEDAWERVEFPRQGPSPSGDHPTTGAELPRRDGRQPAVGGSRTPGEPQHPRIAPLEEGADGQSVNDERWQRAEQLREPRADGQTSSGLPRRVPRANLVEGTATQPSGGGPEVSRAPEDVRGRLSTLRRGIQRGRDARADKTGHDQYDRAGFGPGSTYDQER